MRFLNDLVILKINIRGLSVVWDTQYDTKYITCPKEDLYGNLYPICKSILLERFACKYHLIFSIALTCIDLSKYEPMEIDYKGTKLYLPCPTLRL